MMSYLFPEIPRDGSKVANKYFGKYLMSATELHTDILYLKKKKTIISKEIHVLKEKAKCYNWVNK